MSSSRKSGCVFGWYPISILANDESYTSIEVPTWVSMTKPNDISFSKKHFPPKAEFLATVKSVVGILFAKVFRKT